MNLSIGASSLQGLRPLSSTDGSRDRDRFGAQSFVYTQDRIKRKVRDEFGANVRLTTRESERRPVSTKLATREDKPMAPTDDRPSLTALLTSNTLLIKYKRGDKEIPKLKKSLKKGGYNKMVVFRTDRTLEWSPQYFIDDQLTNLQGYIHGEDLRNNIIDQLDEWDEAKRAAEEEEAARLAAEEAEESSSDEEEDESDGVTSDESENEDEDDEVEQDMEVEVEEVNSDTTSPVDTASDTLAEVPVPVPVAAGS